MRAAFGWLVLVVVVAAGCGDDGETAATSTTKAPSIPMPTTAAPTTAAAAAPKDPALAAKAKAAVLQPSDFPAGWQPKPPNEQLEHETTWQELTRCLGVEDSGQGQASATSPTFGQGVGTQVTSSVEYLPVASAQSIAMAFAGPKFTTCAKEALAAGMKRNAPPGATLGAVEVAPLDFPKLGLLTSATRATSTIEGLAPMPIPVFQDFVFVFKGEAVSRFTFLSPGAPFQADLQRTLAEKVVGRS